MNKDSGVICFAGRMLAYWRAADGQLRAQFVGAADPANLDDDLRRAIEADLQHRHGKRAPAPTPAGACELAATGIDDPLYGCGKCGAVPDDRGVDHANKCKEGRKP